MSLRSPQLVVEVPEVREFSSVLPFHCLFYLSVQHLELLGQVNGECPHQHHVSGPSIRHVDEDGLGIK
ncbi:hypothetical protein E2C01_095833 [Portunus trituberculatus]|uniref:Uncharacterized protein n=1 Tax=Portunus trituberculatus TaxID=210409 RepID=A0A5B7K1F8_PORTR|nr:hypothetical protein [Portunus trituberculatus]